MKKYVSLMISVMVLVCGAGAADLPSIGEKTVGMEKMPGYFTMYWDYDAGKLWMEIDKFDTEFLYVHSLQPDWDPIKSDWTASASCPRMKSAIPWAWDIITPLVSMTGLP